MKLAKHSKILFAILTLMVIILGITEIRSVFNAASTIVAQAPELETKEVGPYTVPVTKSEFLNQLYENIETSMEGNASAQRQAVASAFVADFFTLRDKENFSDVGGLGFVFEPVREQFRTNAIDSYYLDLYQFRAAFGQENLPKVISVNVDDSTNLDLDSVALNDNNDIPVRNVYDLTLTWQYEENDVVDTTNIINTARIRLVQDNDSRNWYVYAINQPIVTNWWG